MSGPVVVAGAGDVGGRLVARLLAQGAEAIALRRREMPPVAGVRQVRADLSGGEGLGRLPRQARAIVFCAAPDQRDERSYRALYVDGLRRLTDVCEASRVLLVSSTAVLGEDDGERVDETTAPRPGAFNGRVLLEAEQVLGDVPSGIVLRLAGLYGPGREALLRKARSGESGKPRWTNRIHVEDAASALSHLLNLDRPMPLYLGSDDLPTLEHEVLAWIRQREGLPVIGHRAGGCSGKRVDNALLRASGWTPGFADYRSGYESLLAEAGV